MLTTKKLLFYSSEEFYTGIYISRAPVLCLAPGPSPGSQFVFIGPGPNFCLPVLAPNLYLPTLAPNSYSTALAPNLYLPTLAPNLYLQALAPNFYLLALVSLEPGLAYTNLDPRQFVFTDPGLRFLLPYSEFAFTFLSIVVAVAEVIIALIS